jgi:hypothetical protein
MGDINFFLLENSPEYQRLLAGNPHAMKASAGFSNIPPIRIYPKDYFTNSQETEQKIAELSLLQKRHEEIMNKLYLLRDTMKSYDVRKKDTHIHDFITNIDLFNENNEIFQKLYDKKTKIESEMKVLDEIIKEERARKLGLGLRGGTRRRRHRRRHRCRKTRR